MDGNQQMKCGGHKCAELLIPHIGIHGCAMYCCLNGKKEATAGIVVFSFVAVFVKYDMISFSMG